MADPQGPEGRSSPPPGLPLEDEERTVIKPPSRALPPSSGLIDLTRLDPVAPAAAGGAPAAAPVRPAGPAMTLQRPGGMATPAPTPPSPDDALGGATVPWPATQPVMSPPARPAAVPAPARSPSATLSPTPSATPSGPRPVPAPSSAPLPPAPLDGAAAARAPRPATLPGTGEARPATLPGPGVAGPAAVVRVVGRYEVRERLGRGGMATVFRAHDPALGRDVALKFLHPSLCEDDEYRARFLREARSAGGLSHPNIVTVHDVGEIEGRPYMAMELIEGETLAEPLAEGQPMAVREVVIMGMQLARALDYAHAKGIVHRDIKPGNIMRVKGTQTVKVTDFGIAHVESLGGGEHRTQVGDILGTPQYMSPEQAQGHKLDGRSDLFSAGIVLYQMLTGARPFQGDSLVALAVKISNEDPKPIEKLRAEVPPALRRVVERCLAKAPERRFQSGREMADALAKVLAELDEAQRERGRERFLPLRVKWAAGMALIVALVMAVAATLITQRQQAAMVAQATDMGASLARLIAAQNAVAALDEDWVSVDVALGEIMKTRDLHSVAVLDRKGQVGAASDASWAGKPPPAWVSEALPPRGNVTVSRYLAGGVPVLSFRAPVTFQGKAVGEVLLGLPEQPLVQVARLSMTLMGALVLVTVAAVAVAMYFVANWFARPIRLVAESMGEIGKGRFDHRIREQRRDEFGQLYAAFDQMAQALQDRQAGASPPTPAGRATPPTAAAGGGGAPTPGGSGR